MHIQLGFITISHLEKEKLKLYGCHIMDCRVNIYRNKLREREIRR